MWYSCHFLGPLVCGSLLRSFHNFTKRRQIQVAGFSRTEGSAVVFYNYLISECHNRPIEYMPQICSLVWVKFEKIDFDMWSQILSMFQSHVFKKPGCKDIKDMTDNWLNWCWVDTEPYILSMWKKSIPLETTIYQLKFWTVVFLSLANVFIFYQLFFLLKGFRVVKYKEIFRALD